MKRYLSLVVACSILLSLISSIGIVAAEGAVAVGYYNLADYEMVSGTKIDSFKEAPELAAMAEKGELPPVAQRLPDNPLVTKTHVSIGEYGGTLRSVTININQDWHMRHMNAANLIESPADPAWDAASSVFGVTMQPGVLESFSMSEDALTFTGTIRKGIKWSDGEPVTTRDVEFFINDVLLNTELNPVKREWLNWGGFDTQLVLVDDYTFQFVFGFPYGSFIEAEIFMWSAVYSKMMLPAHYLEKYHTSYADEESILDYMTQDGYTNIDEWKEWFAKKVALWSYDNSYLDSGHSFPVLDPWVPAKDLGNGNIRFERNPYYYIVDEAGNQLPYIDAVVSTYVSDEEMQNMAIITGEVDITCMSISIDDYPLYKEHEKDGNYIAYPLPDWVDQIFLVGFNANAGVQPPPLPSVGLEEVEVDVKYNPSLAEVYGDVRFRRAMSLALDRDVFNDTLFLGLGRPANCAPRPGTPFFEESMETQYAQYDPEAAKALLDEMGMIDRDGDGWREHPNGDQFTMMYEYFVITGASTPGSELCKRFWEDIGIRVQLKLVDVGYWFSNLQSNNVNEVTTWWLSGSGANLVQNWFFGPSMLVPLWNRYTAYKTMYENGKMSEEDWQTVLAYVPEWQREMQDLKVELKVESDLEKRNEIAKRMWQLVSEYLPIIGTVTECRAPLIANADLGNIENCEELGYNYITVMEQAEQFYFKTESRRAN
jgi:peptide/nickel transport system substrate-binding protein